MVDVSRILPSVRRCLCLAVVLAATAASGDVGEAQTPATHAREHRSAPALTPKPDALAALAQAQAKALEGGEPVAIATATRPLLAHLLWREAELALAENNGSRADELYHQALTLNSNIAALAKIAPRTAAQRANLKTEHATLGHALASAYNDLGTAEARQGQYAAALLSFQHAERWEAPPAPALLHNLGVAAFRTENFAEAARALDLYLGTDGAAHASDANAHLMLGFSQFQLGHFAPAAAAFGAAREATLADPRAAYTWAFSLARTGQMQPANELADRLSAQALPPEVLSLVCHLYVDTENYEGSAACYRKAYQADPTMKLAHYQVGESLIHLDRPAEAIPELQQELAISPANPNVEYSLAFALLQSSRKQEAQTLLTTVTTEHPEHAQAQYQLGKLLMEQGKTEEAIEHLEASERADASPDYVHYQLGTAYRKAGRTADSDRELKQFREIKDIRRNSATHR